jgi:septal ring factor EnvC (AmiA/AmiB activator)
LTRLLLGVIIGCLAACSSRPVATFEVALLDEADRRAAQGDYAAAVNLYEDILAFQADPAVLDRARTRRDTVAGLLAARGEVARVREQLAAREAEVRRLQEQLAAREQALAARERTLAARDGELARAQHELAARQAEMKQLAAEADKLRADLENLKRIDLQLERRR